MTIVCHGEDCPHRQQRERPMKPIDETFHHVVYKCLTCENLRVVQKTTCGGTIGAGRREDQPAPQYIGRGF